MILFHGTFEEAVRKICKEGLIPRDYKGYYWKYVIDEPVCFLSNQPASGPAGNPRSYAYHLGFGGDGYLVVFDIPPALVKEKIVAIFDNKDIYRWWDHCSEVGVDCEENISNIKEQDENGHSHELIEAEKRHLENEMKDLASWLRSRQLSRPSNNCQMLTKHLEPKYIVCTLKILDNNFRKPKLVEKFNPKMQRKLKHKQKTFASLIWHEVFKHLRK